MLFKQTYVRKNEVKLMKNPFKKVYHYLFEYDNDKLSIYNQYYGEIISTLEFALLHHAFVLLSYQTNFT